MSGTANDFIAGLTALAKVWYPQEIHESTGVSLVKEDSETFDNWWDRIETSIEESVNEPKE